MTAAAHRRTFVMAGGGTGGHVVPSLAVARELAARGHRAVFIGTQRGLEAKLVPAAGFAIEWIEIGGFQRQGAAQRMRTLLELPAAVWRSWRVLRRRGAAAVFSLGGYVAAPVVMAAVLRRIPVVVMEPNAVAGMVNRMMGRHVYRALVAMEEAGRAFPPERVEVTGVPVREAFFAIAPRGQGEELSVLITGGSRGSRTLNNAFRESWPLFAEWNGAVRFVHQSGAEMQGELARDFAATGLRGSVEAFLPDMPAAFAQADLVVGRAGGNAVAELAAAGKAAILSPFPYAADDHQARNAETMARAGAAIAVPDAEMNGKRLFELVSQLAADRPRLAAMGNAARRMARPGAAARAADVLEEAAAGRDLTRSAKAETIQGKNVF